MSELVVLAASAAVVVFMVAVAWVLGFRERARLTQDLVRQLGANEGAAVDVAIVGADGKGAVARLSDGRWMVARVMGLDASARVMAHGALKLALRQGRLRVSFADVGYPALSLRLEAPPPAWLQEAAQGAMP
jgi:hypothetical protein